MEDTTTPRRFVATFLEAAQRDDWSTASKLLGLATTGHTSADATERAKELDYLLEKRSWIHLDTVSDEPNGTPEDGANVERVAIIKLDSGEFPIVLEKSKTTPAHWSFSSDTLARVPAAYEERGPSWLEMQVPATLRTTQVLGMETWQWIGVPIAIAMAVFGGRLAAYVLRAVGRPIAKRTRFKWDDELIEASYGPSRIFLTCVTYVPMAYLLGLPAWFRDIGFHIVLSLAIIATIWFAMRAVEVFANMFERRALRERLSFPDADLHARGARTQVQVLRRIAGLGFQAIGLALILMQFAVVRSAGYSLLASAGVAGVVLGLAAQRTIGSVLAGIQLTATQPIRIGDTVVIENESGTIEEITLTYAVLKVWDERRLIIPLSRFLEQPFQNHTKVSSGQIGAVLLYANWTLPVDAVRTELRNVLTDCEKWDKRVQAVHLTDAKERSIEIRVLVSSASPGDLFDLRALVRERLVQWLQTFEGGRHLPIMRVEEHAESLTRAS